MADREPFAPLEVDPRTGLPLPEDVRERLQESAGTVMSLIRNVESYRRRLSHGLGVSVTELRALGRIGQMDGLTPRALADQLGLTTGSVTPLLDRLEQAALIRRTPHPHDRRSIQLELTDEGAAVIGTAFGTFQARLLAAVQSMPSDAVSTANEFLRLAAGGYEPLDEPHTVDESHVARETPAHD
ncbi:MarR family winged helix-turn-helix transcriptional regulator [Naasia sp. SYSU D00057]|uniref:MarR family winged helix-turn-helix transcriptional regulator n=1 Tax=Naasia sp. SYSU D00057 TaxID=2817380 RepID=UPI001B30E6A0|nr:MarR family transcriptional regulator [Naasia sp. SYSU D00057]